MLKHSPQIQIPQRIWHGLVLKQRFTRLFASKLASDHDNSKIIKKHFVFTRISGYLSKRRRRRRRERNRDRDSEREERCRHTGQDRDREILDTHTEWDRQADAGTKSQLKVYQFSVSSSGWAARSTPGDTGWLDSGAAGSASSHSAWWGPGGWSCPEITTGNMILSSNHHSQQHLRYVMGSGGMILSSNSVYTAHSQTIFWTTLLQVFFNFQSQVPLKQFQSWTDWE